MWRLEICWHHILLCMWKAAACVISLTLLFIILGFNTVAVPFLLFTHWLFQGTSLTVHMNCSNLFTVNAHIVVHAADQISPWWHAYQAAWLICVSKSEESAIREQDYQNRNSIHSTSELNKYAVKNDLFKLATLCKVNFSFSRTFGRFILNTSGSPEKATWLG